MKQWIRGFLTIMICGLFLVGCVSKEEKKVSMYDLQKGILEADDTLPDMSTVNSSADNAEDSFAYLSDMDYQKVDGYFLAYSSEGKADEIAVVCLKEEKDVAEAKESLEKHKAGRISLYKTYDPDQVDRAQAGEVFSQGPYVVLIISDGAEKAKEAFRQGIQ